MARAILVLVLLASPTQGLANAMARMGPGVGTSHTAHADHDAPMDLGVLPRDQPRDIAAHALGLEPEQFIIESPTSGEIPSAFDTMLLHEVSTLAARAGDSSTKIAHVLCAQRDKSSTARAALSEVTGKILVRVFKY